MMVMVFVDSTFNFFKSSITIYFIIEYGALLGSVIGSWTFSRPTLRWKEILSKHEKQLFGDNCESNIADIAVVMRTFRDVVEHNSKMEIWKHNISEVFENAGGNCALELLSEKVNTINKTSICVFVTSDNINVTKTLIQRADAIRDSWKLPRAVKLFYYDFDDPDWHSQGLIENSKLTIGNKFFFFLI